MDAGAEKDNGDDNSESTVELGSADFAKSLTDDLYALKWMTYALNWMT